MPVTQKKTGKTRGGNAQILLSSTKPTVISWKVVVHLPAREGLTVRGISASRKINTPVARVTSRLSTTIVSQEGIW